MNNIGFAKIGKSIKFRTNKYSPVGGDNEASCTLRALANNNPDKTFYVIGRSDFSTLSDSDKVELFPYGNVVDVWEGVGLDISEEYYRHVIDYFERKGFELDFTVMMVGQVGSVTIPNKIIKVRDTDDDKPASVLDMTKWYVTPISTWLNEKKPLYVEVVNDPRYTMRQSRDLLHLPKISLGQYDWEYTTNAIRSYEDQTRIERKVKSTYAGMETAFCYDYDYEENVNTNRRIDFAIVLNEGKPSRYDTLNEWVLNHFDDVEIYGKWEHEMAATDKRFRGSKHIEEIQNMMNNVKFTFIIPIAPGWTTSKYIEMIHAGVIPFLHPTYDEQRHLPIPEFLRPKTPKEFHDRMERLLNNKEEYETVLNGLRKAVLKKEYYDGTFINDKIMKSIDPAYQKPSLDNFKKKAVASLDDFFS